MPLHNFYKRPSDCWYNQQISLFYWGEKITMSTICIQICLGDGAQEESHEVAVMALNHLGKKVSVPVATLHPSCLPMVQYTLYVCANKGKCFLVFGAV